jgi:F-type H+-transporting ATPase subunit delta
LEELGRVYGDALFDVAKETGKLDRIHEQLGEFADAVSESHDLQVFLFSPYFSSAEKREGLAKSVSGAEEELMNFLELLAEKHRMPALSHIRRHFEERWAEDAVVEHVRAEVERQTERTIDLRSEVDPDILGGLVLRVGNMVLDASIRSKLEQLRKEVAKAA